MQSVRNVEYHQQNTPKYCGPATAMMILRSIGGQAVQQDDLHTILDQNVDVWSTTPDGLALGLNTLAPLPLRNTFSVVSSSSAEEGSTTIVQVVQSPNAPPPAALVFGSGHWVVVTDVNLAPPGDGTDGAALLGFYINSPSVTPPDAPSDHQAADQCGRDAAHGRLEADQYVSYAGWTSDFFTGYADSKRQVFVTVCSSARTQVALRPPVPPVPILLGRSNGLIDPDTAATQAVGAVASHGIDTRGPLSAALSGVVPGVPLLVRRIDVLDWHYYLVPLLRNGVAVGVARIDAVHGVFMGASAVKPGDIDDLSISGSDEALLLRDGSVAPELVWRPCRETRSPFEPFQQIVGLGGSVQYRRLGEDFRPTPL